MMTQNKDPMDRVLDKLDKMDEKIDGIDKTLVRNTASLEEHMRRTELLEAAIKPVQEHVVMVKGVGKAIGYLGVLVGMAIGIIKFFIGS